MSTPGPPVFTDYMKAEMIAEKVGVCAQQIRDFCKAAGVEPKYLFTQKLYSWTEFQQSLFTKETKNPRKSKQEKAAQ